MNCQNKELCNYLSITVNYKKSYFLISNMKRILILGCVGAGKTALAKKLSNKIKIDYFSTDLIFYDRKWKKRPVYIRNSKLDNILRRNKWIIEGKYSKDWMNSVIKNADTVILLDYPKKTILDRIFRRYFRGIRKRTDYGKLWSLIHLLYLAFVYNSLGDFDIGKGIEKRGGKFLVVKNIDKEKELLKGE